jgi:outer membrane protein TolC
VEQLIPYVGATVSARYDSSSKMTRSTVQAFSPQYDTSFFLEAKVPLARGLIWNQEWTNVKVAGLAYSSSLEGFRTSLMDLVQITVDAYWNLIASRDQVFVAQKSLETARALLEQTKTQYEVGVVSRVEVVESEAGVADRELQVIRSANVYRNSQDQIVNFVLGTELSGISDLHFSPTDDPAAFEPRTVNISRAVDRAFRNRPELQQVGLEIDQGEVNVKFAKNQRLPQLDAEFRYGYVGKAGDPNISLNPAFGSPPNTSSFADAHNDFFKSEGADNFRVMGRFSIPFPNTTARKRVVRNELELRRARTRETRLEQSIILEIRIAARTLLASFQAIEASERRRLAAAEQLRAERIRLEHGESTPFEVLQRESDLVEAESEKIEALQVYRSSEVALERSQGTILDFHNVVLDDAAKLTY